VAIYVYSAHAMSASECHLATSMGPGTFLKNKIICNDEKLNFYLQVPKLKRVIFVGTNNIF